MVSVAWVVAGWRRTRSRTSRRATRTRCCREHSQALDARNPKKFIELGGPSDAATMQRRQPGDGLLEHWARHRHPAVPDPHVPHSIRHGQDAEAVQTILQAATPGELSSSNGPPPASAPRNSSAEEKTIQVEDSADSAKPFQPVRIQVPTARGANTFLRVQRWEGGKWLAFPVPTKTNQSGEFTAYVELGKPGRYQLRVLDPGSGVTSKPFVLVIKG
jgi:hypothetical protein